MDKQLKEKLKQQLDETSYEVIVNKGTEYPHSGKYNNHNETGIYYCTACNSELFKSDAKFEAGCGWPSFDKEIKAGAIKETKDRSHGMIRTEITCSVCDAHLGHVFEDGPTQTGIRYCVNSVSLKFKK
jgi:peptide-methionine (R)-S-oxide reductase